jgi:tetratricopeptide (TPR) repeat protein
VGADDDELARAATAMSSPGDAGLTDTLPSTGPNGEAPEIPRGTEIGRYIVLGPLGSGAMGVVVSAIDPTLDRKVAIKIVKADRGGTTVGQQRLLREAQAMARLSHPNVVTVYEAGTFGERVYLAMEYIAGTTLAGWLATPHAAKAIIEAFVAAGRGLAAAHRGGIVHRDFKPANVLVARDGRVRVADFGLATAPELRAPSSPPPVEIQPDLGMTATGAVMGTPTYMAPEQHRGLVATARADQFAFCVALWEALRGELPFAGTDYAEYAEHVLTGKIRDGGKPVPARIKKALLRGMAVEPEARFRDMDTLLGELAHDSARRTILIGAIAGAVVVAGGAAFVMHRASDPCQATASGAAWTPEARDTLHAAFTGSHVAIGDEVFGRLAGVLDERARAQSVARHDACVATEVRHDQSAELLDRRIQCLDDRERETRALIDVLQEHPDVTAIGKSVSAVLSLPPIEICNDREALLSGVPAPPPALRPQVAAFDLQIQRVKALIDAGKQREAEALLPALVHAVDALPYVPLRARLHSVYARYLDSAERNEQAVAELKLTGELAAEAHDDNLVARSWITLYHMLGYRLARVSEARQLEPVATAAIARAGNPLELRGLMDLARGTLALREEKFDDAIARFQEGTRELSQALGAKHPMVATARANTAIAFESAGKYDDARTEAEQALALRVAALGEDHPSVSDSHYQLGALYDTMEKPQRAIVEFQKALEIRAKVLPPDHVQDAETLISLGVVYNEVGRSKEALDMTQRALAVLEKHPEDNRAKIGTALSDLGDDYRELGRFDEAIATYKRAVDNDVAVFGGETAEVANVIQNLGLAYERNHDDKDAVEQWKHGLAIREHVLGPKHPQVAMSLGALAQNDADHGRHQQAIDELNRAIPMVADLPLGTMMIELRGEERLELHQLDAALADTTHARDSLRETSMLPAFAAAQFGHARVQWALGHKAEAVTEAKAAVATLEKLPSRNPDEEETLKLARTWLQKHS